jgi:hypothetical protein
MLSWIGGRYPIGTFRMPSPLTQTPNSSVNFGGYYSRGFGPKHDEWYSHDLLEDASEFVEEYEKEHGQAIASPPPARV